jgi:hypothetical protein
LTLLLLHIVFCPSTLLLHIVFCPSTLLLLHIDNFICKYWIILAVNTPESLLCCPTWTQFSRNHIHLLGNHVLTLEEEEEEESKASPHCILSFDSSSSHCILSFDSSSSSSHCILSFDSSSSSLYTMVKT